MKTSASSAADDDASPRLKAINNLRSKFAATIGTAGSRQGMPVDAVIKQFGKDWGSLNDYLHEINCQDIHQALQIPEMRESIELRGNFIFPVVREANRHIFSLIDQTKKKTKRRTKKSKSVVPHFRHSNLSTWLSADWYRARKRAKPQFDASTPLIPSAAPLSEPPKPAVKVAPAPRTYASIVQNANATSSLFAKNRRVPKIFWSSSAAILNTLPPDTIARPRNKPNQTLPTQTLPTKVDIGEPIKRIRAPRKNEEPRSCHLTPTKSPAPCKTNVFQRQFERTDLARSQLLQIAKVASASSNSLSTIDSVPQKVRELVAIIYEAGRSITLDDLIRKYYALKGENLSGVRLAEILGLERNKKNHFIALQSYRPSIFDCHLRSSSILISLSKICGELLTRMERAGEITLKTPASSASAVTAAASAVRPTSSDTTSAAVGNAIESRCGGKSSSRTSQYSQPSDASLDSTLQKLTGQMENLSLR